MLASGQPGASDHRPADHVRRYTTMPPSSGYVFSRASASGMRADMDQAAGPQSSHLAQLLREVAGHNGDSLKRLYEHTSAKLYGICLRLLREEGEAQDVLQDVYLVVWRKAGMFDEARASPITWLATIARNRAIDRLRSRRPPAETIKSAPEVADESPSSLDVLEQAEDALRLRDCLDQLEDRARRMIRSAFFEGATYPELAEREGVPLPTMKSWIRRGLQRLRGCLDQ
jgi:RNA polymerase sigma factor (sigma-70 family)